MEPHQILELFQYLERIAFALEQIANALNSIDDNGIKSYDKC